MDRGIVFRTQSNWLLTSRPPIKLAPACDSISAHVKCFSSYGPIAQSVEQLAFNQWVAGSSPARLINNSNICNDLQPPKKRLYFFVWKNDAFDDAFRSEKLLHISAYSCEKKLAWPIMAYNCSENLKGW
jgi:hypothetical protein